MTAASEIRFRIKRRDNKCPTLLLLLYAPPTQWRILPMSSGVTSGGPTKTSGAQIIYHLHHLMCSRKRNGVATGVASPPFGVTMATPGPPLDPPLQPPRKYYPEY